MKFLKKRLIQENHKDKYIWVHPKEAGESRRGKGEGKKFHIKPPESVFTQNQVKTRGAQKSSQRFYFFSILFLFTSSCPITNHCLVFIYFYYLDQCEMWSQLQT